MPTLSKSGSGSILYRQVPDSLWRQKWPIGRERKTSRIGIENKYKTIISSVTHRQRARVWSVVYLCFRLAASILRFVLDTEFPVLLLEAQSPVSEDRYCVDWSLCEPEGVWQRREERRLRMSVSRFSCLTSHLFLAALTTNLASMDMSALWMTRVKLGHQQKNVSAHA